jgi:hypothetical protein
MVRPLWMGAAISAVFAIFGLSFMITMHFRSSSTYLHYLELLSVNTSATVPTNLERLEESALNKSQECSGQSVYYFNTRAAIGALDVPALSTLVSTVVSQCSSSIVALEEKIALVGSDIPHVVLQSGLNYELRQVVLGAQLRLVYLYLSPWVSPMILVTPSIIYDSFAPPIVQYDSCVDGVRPLLPVQSGKFSGTVTVHSYQLSCSNNTLAFYTSGTGTIQLVQGLVIYAWFL